MKQLKIGLVGLMHPNFTGDQKALYAHSIKELNKLRNVFDFELYPIDEGLFTEEDAVRARKELEKEKIDFLLIQNCAFASGRIISILARMDAYIGLWALPEPTKEGPLPINSFCGMNMNASIIGEYLQHYNIPAKWFFGHVEDELFIQRFDITVKALTALINLKVAKVALIGGIAPGFDNQYYDERKLEKRFGTIVYRNLEFSDVKNKALSYKNTEINDILQSFQQEYDWVSSLAQQTLEKHARIYKAFQDIKEENQLDALAVGCWPKYRLELEMVPCATIGRLNNEGIITACEGDVYGLLTMMAMRYITKEPTLLLDLSSIDEEDQSALFWHCGIGCKKLAYQNKVWLNAHCNPGRVPGKGMVKAAPAAEMIFDQCDATFARFTKEGENLFLLSGSFQNQDKPSFDGTRGWVTNLKLNGEKISSRELINTIMVQQVQHHYAFAKGDITEIMLELAAWLDCKPLEKVSYHHYLQR